MREGLSSARCGFLPVSPHPLPCGAADSASLPHAVAHHVQKKATRKHNAYRPRKSRPSDIFRTPPSYPAMPDIPVMTKLDSVSIEVTPDDTADSLRSKVTAAGGASPEQFVYAGKEVTGTLADCGLSAATTIQAAVSK
jgi:hypothetical protein